MAPKKVEQVVFNRSCVLCLCSVDYLFLMEITFHKNTGPNGAINNYRFTRLFEAFSLFVPKLQLTSANLQSLASAELPIVSVNPQSPVSAELQMLV